MTARAGAGFFPSSFSSAEHSLRSSLCCGARSRPRRHFASGGSLPSPTPPEVELKRLTTRAGAGLVPSSFTSAERSLRSSLSRGFCPSACARGTRASLIAPVSPLASLLPPRGASAVRGIDNIYQQNLRAESFAKKVRHLLPRVGLCSARGALRKAVVGTERSPVSDAGSASANVRLPRV